MQKGPCRTHRSSTSYAIAGAAVAGHHRGVRTAAFLVAASFLVPWLGGCSSESHRCVGTLTVDQGVAVGQPSARAALHALLMTRPPLLDSHGWKAASRAYEPNETVTYVAGLGDMVKVTRSSLNGRWYLDRYRGCR